METPGSPEAGLPIRANLIVLHGLRRELPEKFMNRFENQVALITGAAQGIGFGIARRLGGEGAAVAMLDKDEARLNSAAEELGASGVAVQAVSGDVTDQGQVATAVAQVLERFGKIDVLVTSAGMTGQTQSENP